MTATDVIKAAWPQLGLRKPSEITEPGWYWAEDRIDQEIDGYGSDYRLTVLYAEQSIHGVLRFAIDGVSYDAAAADVWFRIIRRIDEPEITGGWA